MNSGVKLHRIVQCPACGVTTVTLSHRRHAFERLITPFARPYRCHLCGSRFFAPNFRNISLRMLFGPAAIILTVIAVIASMALWPLRAGLYRALPPVSLIRDALDALPPGPLALCLFLSVLVACALMMVGVLYSAQDRALEAMNKRLRRVETASIATDDSVAGLELRAELDRLTGELGMVRAELASMKEMVQSEARAANLDGAQETTAPALDMDPADPSAEPEFGAPPPRKRRSFDPIRDTHVEALDAFRRGALADAAALLLRALKWCDERNEGGLSRGIIQYDLARVLASQGDSDMRHRKERYAQALEHLRASLAATDGEIHFKFLCDLESAGAFHQLSLQPDYEPAVTDLMSRIQVA